VRKDNVMACDKCGAKKGHVSGCEKEGNKGNRTNPKNLKLTRDQAKEGYEIVTCITCRGSGKRGMRSCQLCGGRGKIRVNK